MRKKFKWKKTRTFDLGHEKKHSFLWVSCITFCVYVLVALKTLEGRGKGTFIPKCLLSGSFL